MKRIVTVGSYASPIDAHAAVDMLEDAGIPADVDDEFVTSAFGFSIGQGVRIVVSTEHAERARTLIAEWDRRSKSASDVDEESLAEQAAAAAPEGSPAGPTARGQDGAEEERGAEDFVDAVEDEYRAGETWARRTRAFAWLALFVGPVLVMVAFRLTSPPKGLLFSPKAKKHLAQARVIFYATILLYAVLILVGVAGGDLLHL